MTEDFTQPVLEGAGIQSADSSSLPSTVAVVDASDPSDPLSVAVAESLKPVAVEMAPVVEQPACKYHLEYVLDGNNITEHHFDIPHAVSRVSALRRLNIFPRTYSDA